MHSRKTIIIYVDDEPANLYLLAEHLAHLPCELRTYSNPVIALNEIPELRPHLVISDFDMKAKMNGLEFLEKTRQIAPNSIRIILSSSHNFELFKLAINVGKIHSFWKKEESMYEIERKVKRILNWLSAPKSSHLS